MIWQPVCHSCLHLLFRPPTPWSHTLSFPLPVERYTVMSLRSWVDFPPSEHLAHALHQSWLRRVGRNKTGQPSPWVSFLKACLLISQPFSDMIPPLLSDPSLPNTNITVSTPLFPALSHLGERRDMNHLSLIRIRMLKNLIHQGQGADMICPTSSKLDATHTVSCDYCPNLSHENPPCKASQGGQDIPCLLTIPLG